MIIRSKEEQKDLRSYFTHEARNVKHEAIQDTVKTEFLKRAVGNSKWDKIEFSISQFSHSVMSNPLRPHGLQHTRPPCPSPTWSPPKPMSLESVMTSNHLILCLPLLLPPSIFLCIRVFSYESFLRIRWPKDWSFSFSISPSNEHSGLISFRIDWFGLLAVQGTLKSLLQHHSSKASILRHSAFFTVQLSHPSMTTGP